MQKPLQKAPGVGAKTAQRVIIELKDKLSLEDAFEQKLANQAQKAELNPAVGVKNEAILALTSLGYSQSEALKGIAGDRNFTGRSGRGCLKNGIKADGIFISFT